MTARILVLYFAMGFAVHAVASQPAVQTENEAFMLALRAFEEGRYHAAVDRFERFSEDFDRSDVLPDALYYRGAALLASGLDDQAVSVLSEFESRFPAHPRAYEARLALGRYYFESGNAQEAIRTLGAVISRDPPDDLAARALYWMGDAALQLRDTEAALEYYRQSSEYLTTVTAPAALYARAYTLLRRGDYEAGAEDFELLAARYPDSDFSLTVGLALAEAYYELGDYLNTVSEIRSRLPRLNPELHEKAYFLLAESYNQLRDSENSIVYYQRFTEENPSSPFYRRARFGLGWNYHYEEAYQWAADEFAQVRDGSGDELDGEALYYEAVNLKLSAKPYDAAALFQDYSDRFSGSPLADHALFELGLLQYALGEWRSASRAFERLITGYRQSALLGEAFLHRGNTLIALGDFDSALRAFDEAIARNAAGSQLRDEVVFQKAWLLYRREAYEESFQAFSDLLASDPSGLKVAESLFWSAESLFQLDRFASAGTLFRQYLSEYPSGKHVEAAQYALGWTYFRQSQYSRAIPQFENFLRTHRGETETIPYEADAKLRLADSHFALKQYGQAIRVYGSLAADGDDYSLYQIGQAYANAGDPFEAIATFGQLLELFPVSEWREEARYSLGYLFFLNREYTQAISTFQELIRAHGRHPLAAKAQYGIGDAHFNAGRLRQAVDAYLTVLDTYPRSDFATDAARGVQFALIATGEDERSTAIIDSFATANPNSPIIDELRFRRAEVLYQSGQPEDALDDLLTFVRAAEDDRLLAEAYFYLGTIYADLGEDREAETYLGQVVRRYPDGDRTVDAANRLGKIYLNSGRFREAGSVFSNATGSASESSQRAEAIYGHAMALVGLGDIDEAERVLQEAVHSAPDDPAMMPAFLGLGRIYEERGFNDRARNQYRTAASGSRGEAGAEALFRIGSMLRRQGDPRGAIAELDRMATLFAGYTEWMARAYLEQARAFHQMGDTGEAVRLYDTLV
ncbi:tetratricopeptide repeat protein, partial [Rhodothermus sp. AH-315-K08]|nr:tetratricopeptide repeat protein [Rhodothermus sp. AH-315-K08]